MIYEYKCDGCNAVVELQRPMRGRDNETKCVKCGTSMRRVFSPVKANFSAWKGQEQQVIRDAMTPA
jgi:putative FmdB family regulatory protein